MNPLTCQPDNRIICPRAPDELELELELDELESLPELEDKLSDSLDDELLELLRLRLLELELLKLRDSELLELELELRDVD